MTEPGAPMGELPHMPGSGRPQWRDYFLWGTQLVPLPSHQALPVPAPLTCRQGSLWARVCCERVRLSQAWLTFLSSLWLLQLESEDPAPRHHVDRVPLQIRKVQCSARGQIDATERSLERLDSSDLGTPHPSSPWMA